MMVSQELLMAKYRNVIKFPSWSFIHNPVEQIMVYRSKIVQIALDLTFNLQICKLVNFESNNCKENDFFLPFGGKSVVDYWYLLCTLITC